MKRAEARRKRKGGQAMVEWVILAGFLIIGLAAVFGAFPKVLNGFCTMVLQTVCGPLL